MNDFDKRKDHTAEEEQDIDRKAEEALNHLNVAGDENKQKEETAASSKQDNAELTASNKNLDTKSAESGTREEPEAAEQEKPQDRLEEENTGNLIAASMEEPTAQRSNIQKSGGKSKVKGFISLLAAGIVGSALTVFTIPYSDLYQDKYEKVEQQVEDLTKKVENSNSSNITAQTTTAAASSSGNSSSIADMVQASSKAIVGIVNLQKQQTNQFNQSSQDDVQSGSGSGIIFKKEGQYAYIVTNNHVIEGANSLEISLYNGDKTEGKLIGADALTDLAVVRIDAKYATDTIDFGDSSTLRPGDQVWAIGNPLGLDLSRTVTQGIVSAVNRSITVNTSAGDWAFNVIQTDAAINPGNSGGALINAAGKVVGINSLKISEDGVEGLGFAIPSNDLIPIVNEIIEKGKVERPYIGVGLASLEEVPRMYLEDLPNKVTKGVMVTNIDSNSAAAKAGLEVQDVIVSIDGTKLEGSSDLRKYLYTKVKVGDKVKLEIYRNGKLKTVELTLTSNTNAN
ncbi:S1C family serine protease [Niallia sp. 03133]|uniref:S1C family serine protease n=1 Tax=Niallia sp. 03133 TaxID=3458060 RepID=UPI004044521E